VQHTNNMTQKHRAGQRRILDSPHLDGGGQTQQTALTTAAVFLCGRLTSLAVELGALAAFGAGAPFFRAALVLIPTRLPSKCAGDEPLLYLPRAYQRGFSFSTTARATRGLDKRRKRDQS
jgi:hypothetical protein